MRKPLCLLAALSLVAVAGCSDLTHPNEISIIAEPASVAPAGVKAKEGTVAKPGAAVDGSPNAADGARTPTMRAPAPAAKGGGDPGACGG